MKSILVASIVGISLLAPKANAQSLEEILGAVAGYKLGDSIGDGDGRKAARVAGAVLGYRFGERVLNRNSEDDEYYEYHHMPRAQSRILNYCKSQVPSRYHNNSGAFRSWVNGCVVRVEQMQQEIEAQAYEDALNGDGK